MKKSKNGIQDQQTRPPIVAVLGHVDHGKTTLLDTIRKTDIASHEHGGITQKIGAYQITIPQKGSQDRRITFIDTPGHEAFMKMRTRGAHVADIALLVVAADDGVMPQTKESIKIIKEAHIPYVVVINKIDLPAANEDKIKQELARVEVQVEGFGGTVPMVLVSAKQGNGVPDLLKKILQVWDEHPRPSEDTIPGEAVVVETRLDKGKGMVASVIVTRGTLHAGLSMYEAGKQVIKIRALFDANGAMVREAIPGMPVELIGFVALPSIGSTICEVSVAEIVETPVTELPKPVDLADFLSAMDEKKKLKIIIKADTAGSLEAIVQSLGTEVDYVQTGVGDFNEADILLAKSTGAFAIGFNVKVKSEIEKLAQIEGVVIRNYSIIYELLDELHEVLEGMEEVLVKERELGTASIIAEFPFNGERIAGVKVKKGRVARGDQVKILRESTEIGRAKVKSVRRGKDDVTKIEEGGECGLLLDKKIDFEIGDAIIAFIKS